MRANRITTQTALALLAAVLAGCSSDDGPSEPTIQPPTAVDFSDYSAALAAVLPPEFDGTGKADKVEGNYGMWTEGQYAILGKAIGSAQSDEPMSLYRNLNDLQQAISMIEQVSQAGAGTFSGPGPDGLMHTVTVEIVDLTEPVAVPAECRGVVNAETLTLTRAYKLSVPDAQIVVHLGYTQNAYGETVVTWQDEQGEGNAFSVATKNLATGAISIRGAFYKVTDQETASWIYDIATAGDDNTEFVYNMAWYSSTMGDEGGLGCVGGSGDKDTQFGLRYHQYRAPWTRGIYDAYGPYQQLFGPVGDNPYADLNEGGEYPSTAVSLIDETTMFVYDDMPHDFFASPFGE